MSHTKLKRLCRMLKIPSYAGVGILESLWHLAMRETPRGDIGKIPNADIADSIGWDRDCEELIAALVQCNWIDEHKECRLVIHDWHEHADDSTKKYLTRNNLEFATSQVQCPVIVETSLDNSRNVATNLDLSPIPIPIPTLYLPNTSEGKLLPAMSEVTSKMKDLGFADPDTEASAWWDYHEGNQWMISGKPMANWRLTCSTWKRNAVKYGKFPGVAPIANKSKTPVHGVDFINVELPNGDVAEFNPGFTADDRKDPNAWFDRAKWGQA